MRPICCSVSSHTKFVYICGVLGDCVRISGWDLDFARRRSDVCGFPAIRSDLFVSAPRSSNAWVVQRIPAVFVWCKMFILDLWCSIFRVGFFKCWREKLEKETDGNFISFLALFLNHLLFVVDLLSSEPVLSWYCVSCSFYPKSKALDLHLYFPPKFVIEFMKLAGRGDVALLLELGSRCHVILALLFWYTILET